MSKRVSYATALDTLKMLFKASSDGNTLSVESAYVAGGRDLSNIERNKSWLREKMADFKFYQLAAPVYAPNTPKIVERLQLTPQGKKALADANTTAEVMPRGDVQPHTAVSIDAITRDIAQLQDQRRDLKIVFYVTLREEVDAGVLHAMMPIHPGNP